MRFESHSKAPSLRRPPPRERLSLALRLPAALLASAEMCGEEPLGQVAPRASVFSCWPTLGFWQCITFLDDFFSPVV